MDIFQQTCAELGIEGLSFNRDNYFSCELTQAEGGPWATPLTLSIFCNYEDMSLCLAVSTQTELPQTLPEELLTVFAERAIEPFRGGYGIGVLPGSRALTVFQKVIIAGKANGYLKAVLEELVEAAEGWNERLANVAVCRLPVRLGV